MSLESPINFGLWAPFLNGYFGHAQVREAKTISDAVKYVLTDKVKVLYTKNEISRASSIGSTSPLTQIDLGDMLHHPWPIFGHTSIARGRRLSSESSTTVPTTQCSSVQMITDVGMQNWTWPDCVNQALVFDPFKFKGRISRIRFVGLPEWTGSLDSVDSDVSNNSHVVYDSKYAGESTRSNQFYQSATFYRYAVAILADYLGQTGCLEHSSFTGYWKWLKTNVKPFSFRSEKWQRDRVEKSIQKRFDVMFNLKNQSEGKPFEPFKFLCSSFAIILWQCVFWMFDQSLVWRCLPVLADGYTPNDVLQLPVRLSWAWSGVDVVGFNTESMDNRHFPFDSFVGLTNDSDDLKFCNRQPYTIYQPKRQMVYLEQLEWPAYTDLQADELNELNDSTESTESGADLHPSTHLNPSNLSNHSDQSFSVRELNNLIREKHQMEFQKFGSSDSIARAMWNPTTECPLSVLLKNVGEKNFYWYCLPHHSKLGIKSTPTVPLVKTERSANPFLSICEDLHKSIVNQLKQKEE